MSRRVIVSFGPGTEFEYKIHPADLANESAESARQWFDREFIALAPTRYTASPPPQQVQHGLLAL